MDHGWGLWMKLILIVVLAASLAAHANDVSHHARSAQSAAQAQTQPKANPQPSLPMAVQNNVERIARALEAANTKQESADERQRAEQDLRDQDSMANWAFWMFLVGLGEILLTAVGVFLVWRTLIHTRDAAVAARDAVTETRRIGEAQVRAYLSCASARFDINEVWVVAVPVIKNLGQSPAIDVQIQGWLGVMSPPKQEGASFVTLLGSIPASGERTATLLWGKKADDPHIMGLVYDKSCAISVTCEMTWLDVFGKSHSAIFDLAEDVISGPQKPRPQHVTGNMAIANYFEVDGQADEKT